jgi:hypothetical protein
MKDIDEVAAQTLIAEGIDPATAVAGSIIDRGSPGGSVSRFDDPAFQAGLVLGMVMAVAFILWRCA